MDEARRLIRYLYPGLFFIVEILLFFFISAPNRLPTFISYSKNTPVGHNIAVLGGATILLIGLGYFFGIIYHCVIFKFFRPSKHLSFLREAIINKWITLYHSGSKKKFSDDDIIKLDASDAWCILGAYYHARIHDEKFNKAHERIESLNDTMHSLGTTFIASLFAFFTWIRLHSSINEPLCWHYYILPLTIIIIMLANYLITAKEANHFADNITSQFMKIESKYTSINLYVNPDAVSFLLKKRVFWRFIRRICASKGTFLF